MSRELKERIPAVPRWKILGFILILVTATPAAPSRPHPDAVAAGRFSAAESGEVLPEGWRHETFRRIKQHTRYSLVKDEDRVVVRAVSHKGASFLSKKIVVDPQKYSVINWRWKVANILRKGDVFKKKGDDYPARLFVIFTDNTGRAGLPDKTRDRTQQSVFKDLRYQRALAYIWGNKAMAGTMVPSPFSDRIVMFVVRSGSQNLDVWLHERRNIYADYIEAFGKVPPMISGLAIMTDSDNTGESVAAFYGDITFEKNR